jgi:hypothetical protein
MSEQEAYINTWMEHIRMLSEEISPRGPTTEGESRGSEYCRQALEGMGILKPCSGITPLPGYASAY